MAEQGVKGRRRMSGGQGDGRGEVERGESGGGEMRNATWKKEMEREIGGGNS